MIPVPTCDFCSGKVQPTEVNLQRGAVLVIKSAIIKSDSYQGITTLTLGITASSAFWPSPVVSEAHELKNWMYNKLAQ